MNNHLVSKLAFAACLALSGITNPSQATEALTTAEANKKLVITMYERLFNKKDAAAADEFISEAYTQHNPAVPDGRAALKNYVDYLKKTAPQYVIDIKRAVAEGDLVVLHIYAKSSADDRGLAIVEIFRVRRGQVVEHWDVIQAVPEKSANANTMF